MRSWMLASALVSLALASGCGGDGGGGEGGGGEGGGGAGGEGGGDDKPPTATVSATSTTGTGSTGTTTTGTTTTGTSSGGGDTCDDIGICENASNPQDVNTCSACAQLGPCKDLAQKCVPDSPCAQFVDCAIACGQDGACQQGCADANQQGAQDYFALFNCVVCEQCAQSCSDEPAAQGCQ